MNRKEDLLALDRQVSHALWLLSTRQHLIDPTPDIQARQIYMLHRQVQHDKINNLTKDLKYEIDKIVFHYPSINSKRTNGKFVKIKTIMNTNLTKYEQHKYENTQNDDYLSTNRNKIIAHDHPQMNTTNVS